MMIGIFFGDFSWRSSSPRVMTSREIFIEDFLRKVTAGRDHLESLPYDFLV